MIQSFREFVVMILTRFKSLAVRVEGCLLLGCLLLATPPRGESHPALYSSFDLRSAIIQDSGRVAEPLEPGKPLERKIAGGESHLYEIQMSSEQFLRLEVEQRGIDVALTLFAPDGKRISAVDNIQSERGSEAAFLIAKDPGSYRLEVRSNRRTDPVARYEVRIERLQAATEQDRAVNAAAGLIAEANSLLNQETHESLAAAIAKYQEAIPLLEVANDLRMKAFALNRIGTSYYLRTENQKAIEYHSQALLLAGSGDDRQAEASALMDLGWTARANGENQKGLDYLNRSLDIWRLIEDRRGEMEATIRIGSIYSQTGESLKALSYDDEALQLARALGDQRQQVRLAGAIGLAYYAFGDNYRALEIYQQGLVLARANRYQDREASLLGQIGAAYNLVGENQKALEYLKQALQLARTAGERQREASTLQTIGRVYRSTGEYQKALDVLEQSLILLKDINSPTAVARAHYNMGKVYTDLGQYEKALDHLNQALPPWQAVGDQINIAVTIRELARAELGRGNLTAALAQSEAALNLIERLRTQAGGEELRASYLASVQNCFELRVDVLARLHKLNPSQNYAADALQTSERARARSLLDTVAEAGVDIRQGVAPDLL